MNEKQNKDECKYSELLLKALELVSPNNRRQETTF